MKQAIAPLIVVLILGAVAWTCLPDANDQVISQIEANGASISDGYPIGMVSVPDTGGGEKRFGDQEFLSLLPWALKWKEFRGFALDKTSVTDVSIARLKNVPQLQELEISYTPVTAEGLMELRSLPQLHLIVISPNQISEDDLKTLKAAMPNVAFTENRDLYYESHSATTVNSTSR